MTTQRSESTVSAVFVEFRDACGNTTGQALYADWCGRPLPAVGDSMTCDVRNADGAGTSKLAGRVVVRHFDLQHEPDDGPRMWVYLIVASADVSSRRNRRRRTMGFSQN